MTDQAPPEAPPVTQETPQPYPEHAPQFAVIHEQAPAAVMEVTETVQKPQNTRFNAETARLMGQRSAEARRKRKQEAEQAAKNPPIQEPLPPAIKPATVDPELELVQRQIMRVTLQLEDNMEPNERAQLVRALDLMLDRKRILQERPLPGSRRPAPETNRSRSSSFLAPADLPSATPQEGQPQEQE